MSSTNIFDDLIASLKEWFGYATDCFRLFTKSLVFTEQVVTVEQVSIKHVLVFLFAAGAISMAIEGYIAPLRPVIFPYDSRHIKSPLQTMEGLNREALKLAPSVPAWVIPYANAKSSDVFLGELQLSSTHLAWHLWPFVLDVTVLLLTTILLAWRQTRLMGRGRTVITLAIPVIAALLFSNLLFAAVFVIVRAPAIGNWPFVIVIALLLSLNVYASYAVPARAVHRFLQIGWWRTMIVTIVAATIFVALSITMPNPMGWFVKTIPIHKGDASIPLLLDEAEQEMDSGRFREAMQFAAETTNEKDHRSLNAEAIMANAYRMQFYAVYLPSHPVYGTKPLTNDIYATASLNHREWIRRLRLISTHYPESPSVRLFVANGLAEANRCDLAERRFRTVLAMPTAMPYELAHANHRVLSCFHRKEETTEGGNFPRASPDSRTWYAPTKWFPPCGRSYPPTLACIRTMAALLMVLGLQDERLLIRVTEGIHEFVNERSCPCDEKTSFVPSDLAKRWAKADDTR